MNLNKEDKESLKALKNHPWYKVLEKIHEEALTQLGIELLTKSDLDNSDHIAILQKNKIYIQARADFFRDTEKHLREIYSFESI